MKPEAAPRLNTSALRVMFRYVKPYRLAMAGVTVALFITTSAVLSMGQAVRFLVDRGFTDESRLAHALELLIAATVVLALFTYIRFFLVTRVGERVVADIRADLFSHLVRLSPAFFELHKTGDTVSRMTSDLTVLQLVIGSSLSVAARNTLLLLGSLVMLIITNASLSVYVGAMIVMVIVPVVLMGKKVRASAKIAQDKVAELSSFVEESLSSIKTVQAYTQEQHRTQHFTARTEEAFTAAMARVRLRALLVAMAILLSFSAIALTLYIGGKQVLSGELSAGELSSFLFYSVMMASAFGQIVQVIGDLQRASGAAETVVQLLSTPSTVVESATLQHLPEVPGPAAVRFDQVSFSYPTRTTIAAVSHVDFTIAHGERVALVGPSGAGKSTLFQLLLRFYDTTSGTIFVDEVELRNLPLETLRRQFAYVSQEPVLFSATIAENIAFGLPDAPREAIIEAARAAQAFSFIEKLPQGFDTFVGEKGVRLSGGERQRIAIARALLYDPRILLLDEATSALDAENERLVKRALDTLTENRTCLVIAHRLATVRDADRIIVLNHGEIETIGTHEQLLSSSPTYSELARLQFQEMVISS